MYILPRAPLLASHKPTVSGTVAPLNALRATSAVHPSFPSLRLSAFHDLKKNEKGQWEKEEEEEEKKEGGWRWGGKKLTGTELQMCVDLVVPHPAATQTAADYRQMCAD